MPLMHSMMGTLPGKAEWFATMERAGVPMFNDVEEMAEAAGLLARYSALRATMRRNALRRLRTFVTVVAAELEKSFVIQTY